MLRAPSPSGGELVLTEPQQTTGRALVYVALVCVALSAVLLLGTAASGPSAASPALAAGTGWRSALPPWTFEAAPSSGLVTVLLDLGYLLGALGVGLGLWAARRGVVLPRWSLPAACVAAALAALVPPLGSADHLSYAAYGRIAAAGGDPYFVSPAAWRGGLDPVVSAVEPPWTTTTSVYGPVATAVQALTSWCGGDSVRATVWFWQLVVLASWLAVGLLLVRLGRRSGLAERACWVWLLNPVLLGLLVLGAHVDVLGVALGMGALALAGRRPLVAGVLLAGATDVKVTFALLGPAVVYALIRRDGRQAWRPVLWGLFGALVVMVPGHLWAGPHVLDQLQRARRFVSLATPWRPVVDALTGPLPNSGVRTGVVLLTPVVVLALSALLWRVVQLHQRPGAGTDPAANPAADPVVLDAARLAVVLATAYLIGVPYSLPWYDALAWAPLALVAVPVLDGVLLVRLVSYAVAYVPGRVLGSSPQMQELTVGYRRQVVPWLGWLLLVTLVVLAVRRPRAPAG